MTVCCHNQYVDCDTEGCNAVSMHHLTMSTRLREDCQEVQKAGQGTVSIFADVLHQPGNAPARSPFVCRHVSNQRCNRQAQLRPDRL